MPFTFNAVELCIMNINEKSWARAKEVCRTLEYDKTTKTADIVKAFCSWENDVYKWQLSSVHAACIPFNCPKELRKDDYYINEEGMIELLVGSQQPMAKELAEYMGIKIIRHKYVWA